MADEAEKERRELLERIWLAEAHAFAAILEETPFKGIAASAAQSCLPWNCGFPQTS